MTKPIVNLKFYGNIEVSCRRCGRPMNVMRKHLRSGRGRYCSRICADQAKRSGWKDRLWRNIDRSNGPDSCWLWKGKFFENGYPKFAVEQKVVRAHRIVAETCLGPIPNGWIICHECDNPKCCNPIHLFIGTHKANAEDMVSKNRVDRKVNAMRDKIGRFVAAAHSSAGTTKSITESCNA